MGQDPEPGLVIDFRVSDEGRGVDSVSNEVKPFFICGLDPVEVLWGVTKEADRIEFVEILWDLTGWEVESGELSDFVQNDLFVQPIDDSFIMLSEPTMISVIESVLSVVNDIVDKFESARGGVIFADF